MQHEHTHICIRRDASYQRLTIDCQLYCEHIIIVYTSHSNHDHFINNIKYSSIQLTNNFDGFVQWHGLSEKRSGIHGFCNRTKYDFRRMFQIGSRKKKCSVYLPFDLFFSIVKRKNLWRESNTKNQSGVPY